LFVDNYPVHEAEVCYYNHHNPADDFEIEADFGSSESIGKIPLGFRFDIEAGVPLDMEVVVVPQHNDRFGLGNKVLLLVLVSVMFGGFGSEIICALVLFRCRWFFFGFVMEVVFG
jgi:hypothetical protein